MALQSRSAAEAADRMQAIGMPSSAHVFIADDKEAIGFEFTATTFARLPRDSNNCVVHSNYLIGVHPDVYELGWLEDSPLRVVTMNGLVTNLAQKKPELSPEGRRRRSR